MQPIRPTSILVCLIALTLLAGNAIGADPLDLKTAVQRALEQEAEYRSVRAELAAVREEKPRARAGLLPTLSASGTYSNNRVKRTLTNGLSDEPDYVSRNYNLTLKQPLFRRDSWIRYQQADTRISSAEHQAEVERVKLILRVSEQYFYCLYADAVTQFARAEVSALEGLLISVTRGFESGATTRTDVLDAEARLDSARVKLIEAEQNADAVRRALESSTGQRIDAIFPIQPDSLVLRDPNLRIQEWREAALATNPEIEAARENVQLARQEVKLQQAGHYPTLDLIAQHQFADNETISTLGARTTNNLWGLQFNVPLYAGGLVSASIRQAGARLERAHADLDSRTADISLRTARAVESLLASSQRVKALNRAEASARASLTGTEKGVQAGTRSFIDVLNARQQLFEAMQSKARANADFILGLLYLKATTGFADETAINEANAFLDRGTAVKFLDQSL